jgi:hypothetical protein
MSAGDFMRYLVIGSALVGLVIVFVVDWYDNRGDE